MTAMHSVKQFLMVIVVFTMLCTFIHHGLQFEVFNQALKTSIQLMMLTISYGLVYCWTQEGA